MNSRGIRPLTSLKNLNDFGPTFRWVFHELQTKKAELPIMTLTLVTIGSPAFR
ncbi:MAG: hypothetical protein ACXW03_02630 [Methylobacter sp.]